MLFLSLPSVLSDEHARAIYDIFGKKGLEVEGWEVFTLSYKTVLPKTWVLLLL